MTPLASGIPLEGRRPDTNPVGSNLSTDRADFYPRRLIELHHRVLAADSDVANEVCDLLLPEVRRRISRSWSDSDAIESAAEDALVAYLRQPNAFDPARGSLLNWLVRIALNRLAVATITIG